MRKSLVECLRLVLFNLSYDLIVELSSFLICGLMISGGVLTVYVPFLSLIILFLYAVALEYFKRLYPPQIKTNFTTLNEDDLFLVHLEAVIILCKCITTRNQILEYVGPGMSAKKRRTLLHKCDYVIYRAQNNVNIITLLRIALIFDRLREIE